MLTLLALFATSAFAAINELPLGSGLSFSLAKGDEIPPCVSKITVPADVAGANCKIEFRAFKSTLFTGSDMQYDFHFRKGDWAFVEADKLAHTDTDDLEIAEAACPTAGDYYLGLTIKTCTLCVIGKTGDADVTATLKLADGYNVYLGDTDFKTTQFALAEQEWVKLHFSLNETATPHFDIDKCATCTTDNYDYFYVPKGGDLTNEATRNETTASGTNKVVIEDLPAGDWTLGIYFANAVVGSSTRFTVEYALNKVPSVDYADGTCFKSNCTIEATCGSCTDENCHWCETARSCTAGACPADEKWVAVEEECVDIDAICTTKNTCGLCAATAGCVWCNTGDLIGLDTGSCSAGKSDEGKECSSPTATAITEISQCEEVSTITVTGTKVVAQTDTDGGKLTDTVGNTLTEVVSVVGTSVVDGAPATTAVLSFVVAVVACVALFN